ncbi:MAG: acyl-ACP--UDP-N-acetylglucosamine O-acyltransferase [Verrucomicrobiia bacterium]
MPVHPTAVISPEARLDDEVEVGPWCTIGPGVELGPGCRLISHVVLQGPSRFGARNLFHPFCSIGGKTQDLKYTGEPTYLVVGDDNEFREYVTVNRGTGPGESTVIGHGNHFLAYAHVAHNCTVGNHCIFSNNGTLAGHVEVGDHVVIGGLAAVHQFCRIGDHALVGGCTKIVQDVPPYVIADGNPAAPRSINLVGLQRRGFPEETIRRIRQAFRVLYAADTNTSQALAKLESSDSPSPEIAKLIAFVRSSQRGIIR